MFILKLAKVLEKNQIPYAIVGGYAVALHGAVRGTVDIDFITRWGLKNLEKIEKALEEIGLSPRLPITAADLFHFKEEYIKNKNLIAWNFFNKHNPTEQVDVIITYGLEGQSLKKLNVQGQVLKILSKKDLIAMKRQSARPQDFADIEALEKLEED